MATKRRGRPKGSRKTVKPVREKKASRNKKETPEKKQPTLFEKIQEEEAKTWIVDDENIQRDKLQRETVRYPLLAKQMGLNNLDTSWMTVMDIGAGPVGGVSTVLNAKQVYRVDPLADEYAKIANVDSYIMSDGKYIKAEESLPLLKLADLIIVTNALDHFENPALFLANLGTHMKPGAYFAHLHAIDNAITHRHPAHIHNFNPDKARQYLSDDFECVWYMDYKNDGLTYGWRKQPAFSGLYRKVTGYGKD